MQRDMSALSQRSSSLPPSVRQGTCNPAHTIPNHLQPHKGEGPPLGPSQTLLQAHQHEQQQRVLMDPQRQQGGEYYKGEVLGGPYYSVGGGASGPLMRCADPVQRPQGQSPVHTSISLAGSVSAPLQQQWQQQQLALQMHQQMGGGIYAAPGFQDNVKSNGAALRPTQLLPMRLLGDLRLYVPHREPFLGEGGSVHMYLLGKQVRHTVATDEAEECTRDILSLIETQQVPSDSTMPLLIHDGRVICGGPEVCLRYLAKKLGQYGGDHLRDGLLDRLLMDLNTWFNVQQAAIQSILSAETLGKEAVNDYLRSRRHFYIEAEKLLAFFNRKHTGNARGPTASLDSTLRGPVAATLDATMKSLVAGRGHPFFLGDEDSLADYFLFSLIDDDQRIAECLLSSSAARNSGVAEATSKKREDHQDEQQTENETAELAMHYFDETPHLHALYLGLLNLPLIQEALLSSDYQDATPPSAAAIKQERQELPGEGRDRTGPCIATEASTTASVNDSPLQQLQRQQMRQLQQQHSKQLPQMGFNENDEAGGHGACYFRPAAGAYCLPTAPPAAAALHTTLPGGLPASYAANAGYMQHMLPVQVMRVDPPLGTYGVPPYWHPVTPGTQAGHQWEQRDDYHLYGTASHGAAYMQQHQQHQPQGGHRGLSMQQLQQQPPQHQQHHQHYTNACLPHSVSPQVAARTNAGGAAPASM